MSETTLAIIDSKEGFYVGDICYALDRDTYHGVWGGAGYKDGEYTDPATGLRFAVAGTAYGDGTYRDDGGRLYDVDAGVIGVVPAELARKGTDGGHYFEGAGKALFVAQNGIFKIMLSNGTEININTAR